MTTGTDDTLAVEMIGLLRDIKQQQDAAAQKAAATERAVLSLTQSVAALDDRRMGAITMALYALAGAILIAGLVVAAAITWGV